MTATLTTDNRRRTARTWVLALAIPVALLMSALLVFTASFSAFTATTATDQNEFATGSVALTNEQAAGTVLNLTNLQPGDVRTAEIDVIYTGTLDADVRLFARLGEGAQSLAPYISLTITRSGGGEPVTMTLAQFQAQHTNWSTGLLGFQMDAAGAPGTTETFTIEYTVLPTAPQTSAASVVFVWEAQGLSTAS